MRMTMNELNKRFKLLRLSSNITQEDLSQMSGVSLATIKKFESGSDIKISTLEKLLCQLGMENAVNELIPDVSRRPSYKANLEDGNIKKRAHKVKKTQRWEWGE